MRILGGSTDVTDEGSVTSVDCRLGAPSLSVSCNVVIQRICQNGGAIANMDMDMDMDTTVLNGSEHVRIK